MNTESMDEPIGTGEDTKVKDFETDSVNQEEEHYEEEDEEEDYLNQVFEPVDPADLPTFDEVRRLKQEFDENSKSVENLIQIAKDSKLEKNLLQTIHLKLPDRKRRPQSARNGEDLGAPGSQDKVAGDSTTSITVTDVDATLITKIPNQTVRQNCLYSKEISYYDGIPAETPSGESVSYFYRQLKKEQVNLNENSWETEGTLEVGDRNFIKQWRQLQKRESEAKLAMQAAAAADAEVDAAVDAAAGVKTAKMEEKGKDKGDSEWKDGGSGAGDQKLDGIETRKNELASFTQNLGRKISRLHKDAARLMDDSQQTSFMREQAF